MNDRFHTESEFNSFIELLINYRRLVFSLVIILFAVGVMAIQSMSRQEDPSFPYRVALVKVIYPGGVPAQIEKLITEPLEEELAQVSEVREVKSVSQDDIAIFNIELYDYVYDTDSAWDRVQRAIARAESEFPSGVSEIDFNDRKIDMATAVISITGADDTIVLANAAKRLKKELLSLPGVSRIDLEGEPDKELIIKLDQQEISRLGLSRQYIANTIAQRNLIIPGGLISTDSKNIRLNPHSDYESIDELKATILHLPSGQTVPLSAIAQVGLEPKLPLSRQVFKDAKPTVSLGIIALRGQVDSIDFGNALRQKIELLREDYAPLRIEESFFQPDYVQARLDGLQRSLFFSITIIALVVFFAMGWRTGVLVSLVLPIVAVITIGLYSVSGGVFHQMAVIGLVIALGILIDNAIVVIEYIETALRNGEPAVDAIRSAIRVLAKPLMASTGTTVAAFIPLLLAKGGVGDFTRAVPIMITIALIVSYFISMFLMPLIAFYWLKPKKNAVDDNTGNLTVRLIASLAKKCADMVEFKTKTVFVVTFVLVGFSLLLAPSLKREFFPSTDRAQIVIDIEMPSNTPLSLTEQVSRKIERQALDQDAVVAVYRSVGGAGFRFYYNLGGASEEPHVARLTVNTLSQGDNLPLVQWVRDTIKPQFPDAVIVPRLLGQGPPRVAPIEIRIKHNDLATLFSATQKVKKQLSSIDGVTELRSNLDSGTPELEIEIQEQTALSLGVQPNDVARAVFSESRGLSAGQFRYDNDPIPIRVRSSDGAATSMSVIRNQYVYGDKQQAVPISQLASLTPKWTPTTLRHHNDARTVLVLAEVKKGYGYNQVLEIFERNLPSLKLDPSVVVEYGGDAEASSIANKSIATAAPLAVGLLTFFMMFQFNSFRRILIVFATIPLAAVGVVPGLWLSGQPFGFQSLLGIIALVGIVVNNAIVLIDVVDQALAKGLAIKAAVRQALMQRTAPILLTTATTILGLLPLALSSSTLWPPMAWAIISGLLLSTVLTLVAIPALCIIILGKKQDKTPPIQVTHLASFIIGGALVFMLSLPSQDAVAQQNVEAQVEDRGVFLSDVPESDVIVLQLSDVIGLVASNRQLAAAREDVVAAKNNEALVKRKAWAPTLTVAGEFSRREDDSEINFPTGTLSVSDASSHVYSVKVTQPLFQPALQRYQTARANDQTQASAAQMRAVEHQTQGLAIKRFLSILLHEESVKADQALKLSLLARRDRIEKELVQGQALKTDLLQIKVELNRIEQRLFVLNNQQGVELSELAKLLNLDVNTPLKPQETSNLYTRLVSSDTVNDGELSCKERADCLVLERQMDALKNQRKSVSANALPSVNLSLEDRRSDGLLFVSDSDQRAVLEFSWDVFSGGQRQSQKRQIKATERAMQQRLISMHQQIQVDIARAVASQKNGLSSLRLATLTLELSEERLRLSRKRYDNGLLNLDQLLDAEASLTSSKADVAKAKIVLVQAWVDIQLAVGQPFDGLLDR